MKLTADVNRSNLKWDTNLPKLTHVSVIGQGLHCLVTCCNYLAVLTLEYLIPYEQLWRSAADGHKNIRRKKIKNFELFKVFRS